MREPPNSRHAIARLMSGLPKICERGVGVGGGEGGGEGRGRERDR